MYDRVLKNFSRVARPLSEEKSGRDMAYRDGKVFEMEELEGNDGLLQTNALFSCLFCTPFSISSFFFSSLSGSGKKSEVHVCARSMCSVFGPFRCR
jgi:hypothetical protein